jgi:hypothetical protein
VRHRHRPAWLRQRRRLRRDLTPGQRPLRRLKELQRSIDVRVDDLIAATNRSRSLREEAGAYQGNWRDVVLVLCVVLFAVIWWNVPHGRTNWLLTFMVLILLAVVTAVYAMRGVIRSQSKTMHRTFGDSR